jgi:NAD(P)H-nitrite reductase large subunit
VRRGFGQTAQLGAALPRLGNFPELHARKPCGTHISRRIQMSNLPASCIAQRDKETYAVRITPRSGVVTPDELEAVAKVAREHNVPLVKITSGQRFALIGLKEEAVNPACEALPYKLAGHYVQACPGNAWCKFGTQDSLAMSDAIDQRFSSAAVPAKIKFGVSGCPICCAESYVRDIGLVGSRKGWTIVLGGNSGSRARIADVLTEGLSTEEALDCIDRFLDYYRENGKKKQRVARFVEAHGIDAIREALGL